MDSLIDGQHGLAALLAGIIIVLALQLVVRVIQFVFEVYKKKAELTEDSIKNLTASIDALRTQLATNIQATHQVEERMRSMESSLGEVEKAKHHIRKAFAAIKYLAGDEWPRIKTETLEDDLAS